MEYAISLADHLKQKIQLSEENLHAVNQLTTRTVLKGDFLLRAGEISRYTYYVEKGLLSYYSIDEKGKQHILQFAAEEWFIADRCSLFFQQPSPYFIEAIEDTVVTVIPTNFFDQLAEKEPAFVQMNTHALHLHILHLQKRIEQLLSNHAEDRYKYFLETYSSIAARIPQTLLASYLGITPESLSRVRKDIAQKRS